MENKTVLKNKIEFITIARVFAILLVFCFHPLSHYPIFGLIYKVSNIGPYLFLLISGYLYGKKNIVSFKSWYFNRIAKIAIPASIFSLICIILLLFAGAEFSFIKFICTILNLEGLSSISIKLYDIFTYYFDLGYLWFVTIILICYLFVPCLQQIIKKKRYYLLLLFLLTIFDLYINSHFEITIKHFIIFMAGYYYSQLSEEFISSNKFFTIGLIVFTVILAVRFLLRQSMYGSITYKIYAEFSFGVIAIFIFWLINFFCLRLVRLTKIISENCLVKYLDDYSYEIYITHGFICLKDTYDIFILLNNKLLAFLLYVSITIIASYLLKKASSLVYKSTIHTLS